MISGRFQLQELENKRWKRDLEHSNDLNGDAVVGISSTLRELLADVFTLYLKTKDFHWHMSGYNFRDYRKFASSVYGKITCSKK